MTDDRDITTADLPVDAAFELEDPEQGYKFTQVRDWITLLPTLDHTAYRVYSVLLALATKQSQFRRRLTKDSVRWAMPGVSGKPMASRTFENALKTLERHQLVSVTDKRVEQVRAEDGTYRRDESWRFSLKLLPPDADNYTGYRSVMDKLDDYPGPGWDSPSSHRTQNSADGSDQQISDSEPDLVDNSRAQNSAHGQTGHRAQNSADPTQNSASSTGPHLGKQDPPIQSFHTEDPSSPYVGESPGAREAGAGESAQTGRGETPEREEGRNNLDEDETPWTRARDLMREVRNDPDAAHLVQAKDDTKHEMVRILASVLEAGTDQRLVTAYLLHELNEVRHQNIWLTRLKQFADGTAPVLPTSSATEPEEIEIDDARAFRDQHGEPELVRLSQSHVLVVSSLADRGVLVSAGCRNKSVRVITHVDQTNPGTPSSVAADVTAA